MEYTLEHWRTFAAAPNAGLWVDHAGATVVTLRHGFDPAVRHFDSGVVGGVRPSGGWSSTRSTQSVSDDKKNDRRRQQQLKRYFERLAVTLDEADKVLILGPGEAKLGLQRTLQGRSHRREGRVTVRTADRMTEPELIAAVRKFFRVD